VTFVGGLVGVWKRIRDIKPFIQRRAFVYFISMAILFFYIWSLDRQLFLFHRNKINKTVIGWVKTQRFPLTNDSIQFLGSTEAYIFCFDWKTSQIWRLSVFVRIQRL
jgi:hypothetical protein